MKKRLKYNPLELDIRDDRLFDPLSCVFGTLSVVFLAFVYWYFGFDTFKSVLQIIGLIAGITFFVKIYWEGASKMFDTEKQSKEIHFDGCIGEATLDAMLRYTSNGLNDSQSKLDCIECELDNLQLISTPEDADASKSLCEAYVTNLDTTFAHTLDCTVTTGTIHTQLHKIEPCPHCYGDIDDSGYCKYCGSRVYVWR